MAIILILLAVALPGFMGALVRSKATRATQEMRGIYTALVSYRQDHRQYFPAIRMDFYSGVQGGEAKPRFERLAPLTSPVKYMDGIPKDPFAVGGIDGDVRSTPPNDVYIYWDEETTKKFRDANGYTHSPQLVESLGKKEMKRGEGILLISVGPDQKFDVDDSLIPASAAGPDQPPAPGVAVQPEYNPTNGTHSNGNIYFVGAFGKDR